MIATQSPGKRFLQVIPADVQAAYSYSRLMAEVVLEAKADGAFFAGARVRRTGWHQPMRASRWPLSECTHRPGRILDLLVSPGAPVSCRALVNCFLYTPAGTP